jgi:hypothetical protein
MRKLVEHTPIIYKVCAFIASCLFIAIFGAASLVVVVGIESFAKQEYISVWDTKWYWGVLMYVCSAGFSGAMIFDIGYRCGSKDERESEDHE